LGEFAHRVARDVDETIEEDAIFQGWLKRLALA
jgi:hypothetical protein